MALLQTNNTATFSANADPTVAFASNTAAGSLLIVGIQLTGSTRTINSVVDSQGNVYAQLFTGLASTKTCEFWYAGGTAGGANTITFHLSGTGTGAFVAREYSGLISAPLDAKTSATGTSTAPSSGASAATVQADELIIGMYGGNNSTSVVSAGTNYANMTTNTSTATVQLGMEDRTVSATGAQTATFSAGTSLSWIAGVATFKIAASLSAANDPAMYLRLPAYSPRNTKTIITDY